MASPSFNDDFAVPLWIHSWQRQFTEYNVVVVKHLLFS